jgi:hypothetical protein
MLCLCLQAPAVSRAVTGAREIPLIGAWRAAKRRPGTDHPEVEHCQQAALHYLVNGACLSLRKHLTGLPGGRFFLGDRWIADRRNTDRILLPGMIDVRLSAGQCPSLRQAALTLLLTARLPEQRDYLPGVVHLEKERRLAAHNPPG